MLRLGSINILPSLSGWLSCRLVLDWSQVSLWEDEDENEDGFGGWSGSPALMMLRDVSEPPWSQGAGWVGRVLPSAPWLSLPWHSIPWD